jgi:hypothetical protein
MTLGSRIKIFLEFVHPTLNEHRDIDPRRIRSPEPKIDITELRGRYKAYLGSHYLGLHITVVSVVLAVAGVAAASLITRPMGPDYDLIDLWLLWVGSLGATAVAYGGPMVGVFALPASIPSASDLLLPLLVGISEFLLFTILIHQVTPVGLNNLVDTWLIIMACFAALAELSILRARQHFEVGIRASVYPDDVLKFIRLYLQFLRRDALGAGAVIAVAAIGCGLRVSGTILGPPFLFPLVVTVLLLLGLLGHSETAKMWQAVLAAYDLPQGDEIAAGSSSDSSKEARRAPEKMRSSACVDALTPARRRLDDLRPEESSGSRQYESESAANGSSDDAMN